MTVSEQISRQQSDHHASWGHFWQPHVTSTAVSCCCVLGNTELAHLTPQLQLISCSLTLVSCSLTLNESLRVSHIMMMPCSTTIMTTQVTVWAETSKKIRSEHFQRASSSLFLLLQACESSHVRVYTSNLICILLQTYVRLNALIPDSDCAGDWITIRSQLFLKACFEETLISSICEYLSERMVFTLH